MTLPVKKIEEETEHAIVSEATDSSPETIQWMSWQAVEFIQAPSLRIFQWTVLSLTLLTFIAGGIACWVKLDVAVEAPGEVTADSSIREVFVPIESQVLQVDHVIGDHVKKDEVIARLATGEISETEFKNLSSAMDAEITRLETVKSGSELETDLKGLSVFQSLPHLSEATLTQRFANLEQASRALLEQRALVSESLKKELLPLIEKKKNLSKSLDHLLHSQKKKLLSYYIESTQDEIRKISGQESATQNQFRTRVAQSISDFLKELRLTSSAIKLFLSQHMVIAPIDGRIVKQNLFVNSRIAPNTSVSALIPESAGWISRIRVQPRDVIRLKVGQRIYYKVDGYSFEQFGLFSGEVLSIEPIREDPGKTDPVFIVTGSIKAPDQLSDMQKSGVRFMMGLGLNAKILTDRKTVSQIVIEHLYPSMGDAKPKN